MSKTRPILISTVGTDLLLTNYGSFFQHYCLRRFLKCFGYETIRYVANGEPCIGAFLFNARCFLHDFFRLLYFTARGEKEGIKRALGAISLLVRGWLFQEDFQVLISPRERRVSFDERPICICGSDQVLMVNRRWWFGGVPSGCRRIIYAGSANWELCKVDSNWHRLAREELPKFAFVGVREELGKKLCGLYAKDVVQVLDPVLLVERHELERIATKKIFGAPTLLVYLVNIRENYDFQLDLYAQIAKRLSCELRIVGIQGSEKYIPKGLRLRLSPIEFLSAYSQAKYVITNSFHGTVFAIQFHRRFVSLRQRVVDFDQNVRQGDLLGRLKLLSQWLPSDVSIDGMHEALVRNFDWNTTDQIIDKERKFSALWLMNAITEAEGDYGSQMVKV